MIAGLPGNLMADAITAASYAAMTLAIVIVLRQRRDLSRPTRRLGGLLSIFLGLSAASQVAELGDWPLLSVWLRWGEAFAALLTAFAVWPQIPRVLALPSPDQLARANSALEQANETLSAEVERRTHDLQLVRQRFEQALAGSNITVYTEDRDFRLTWIHNARFGSGRSAEAQLPPELAADARALKEQALRARTTGSLSLTLPTENEGLLYLDLTVSPTFDTAGAVDGVLCTLFDFTEQRLFERRLTALAAELATSYRRFELALENSPISVFEQDRDLRYSYFHNAPPDTRSEDFIGRTDPEVYGPEDGGRLAAAKLRVLATGQREQLETEVTRNGRSFYYHLTLEPRTSRSGERIEGVIGTIVDLSERRQTERQMHLVMRELTHRSKNLLAVIQSMARKTAGLSDNIDDFVEDFSSRLRSIASAHDLLVSKSWSGARLEDLVRTALAQSLDPSGAQLAISGPDLTLTPDTAQNLALALHELTTNAMKYGALSVATGRLAITWSRDEGRVRLTWEEEGGPPVTPPAHTGFGRILLERLVGATLGGAVTIDFRSRGIVCNITFSEDRLVLD